MASEVDICNLALSHLGDEANVASISPPDQSIQAALCARFYPVVRDSVLELHNWGFATRRTLLAQLDITVWPWPQWQYAYAEPDNTLTCIKVFDSAAANDWSTPLSTNFPDLYPYQFQGSASLPFSSPNSQQGVLTPQAFVTEQNPVDGTSMILTNQVNAMLMHTVRVTDTSRFSSLFVETAACMLASRLAGPIIKGAEGRAVAKEMLSMAMGMLSKATLSDAGERHMDIAPSVPWMVNR